MIMMMLIIATLIISIVVNNDKIHLTYTNLHYLDVMRAHTHFIYTCQTYTYPLTFAFIRCTNRQRSERAQITPAPGA